MEITLSGSQFFIFALFACAIPVVIIVLVLLARKHNSETKQKILGGILFVIVLCVLLAIPSTRAWMKNTFFPEKPWLGLYYPDAQSHLAEDKTFKTLEECRQWANGQSRGRPLGEWDYSCGYKCEYTRDMLRQQKPGFEFDCETVTK